MKLDELLDSINSLTGFKAIEIDNLIQIGCPGPSNLVIMEFDVEEVDFNDIDVWWDKIHSGPRTTMEMLKIVANYCDTPVEERGIDEQSDGIKHYIEINGRLVEVTQEVADDIVAKESLIKIMQESFDKYIKELEEKEVEKD